MPENSRSRVGRHRRAKTNARLFDAFFQVFDEGGIQTVSVDSVRGAAGLSRGSFYNYFDTLNDFLTQVSEAVGTIINQEQILLFHDEESPSSRISGYLRYFIARALSDKACASVLLQTLPFTAAVSEQMRQRMLVTFKGAAENGEIDIESVPRAVEISLGILTAMLRRALQEGLNNDRIAGDTVILLRGLGVPKSRAVELARLPLPKMPAVSLRQSALNRGLNQPISFET